MEDSGDIRLLVCQRIGEVENAVKSLQRSRKSLLYQAYEAKQSILNAFISERDEMHKKEMRLLVQVDNLLQSKDDALVTQLSKLNQVLGCLRNCLESPHPCGDCLEKFDDIDMLSVQEVTVDLASANELLKETMKNYKQFPASSTFGREVELDGHSTTKWLVTPPSNHSTESTQPDGSEFISTEWLLQHHAGDGGDARQHFTHVRSQTDDQWLRSTGQSTNSLCGYVFKRFFTIMGQDQRDWLYQTQADGMGCSSTSGSESDSESSVTSTSSLSSSCIILPSTATSDSSNSSFTYLSSHLARPPPRSATPLEVSEWVASCQPNVDDNTWIADSTRVATAVNSYMDEDEEHEVIDEWLCRPQMSASDHIPETYHSVHTTFTSGQQILSPTNDEWLVKMNKLGGEVSGIDWQQEKCDSSSKLGDRERDEWLSKKLAYCCLSEGYWLQDTAGEKSGSWVADHGQIYGRQKSTGYPEDDWLCGEEKGDLPESKAGVGVPSLDREWLLVKNHLTKISNSSDSLWLM